MSVSVCPIFSWRSQYLAFAGETSNNQWRHIHVTLEGSSVMSQPVYRLGQEVHTPAHGDGVVVTINRGAVRGRTWREISYTIKLPGASNQVVYYESELTKLSLGAERGT
jgi:hypothetical protein